MTHDELLAIINKNVEKCEPDCHDHDPANKLWLALESVVGLHQPLMGWRKGPNDSDFCACCGSDVLYPCMTIRAIQRELNK